MHTVTDAYRNERESCGPSIFPLVMLPNNFNALITYYRSFIGFARLVLYLVKSALEIKFLLGHLSPLIEFAAWVDKEQYFVKNASDLDCYEARAALYVFYFFVD